MKLKDNEIHIWRYDVDAQEFEQELTNPILSATEKARCNAYMFEAEKIRYICNHRFIRKVLASYLNIAPAEVDFSLTAMGKPYIKNSGLYFNYSYRSTLGLLAITTQKQIGVDIERIKPLQDPQTLASFSFSDKEKEIIFNSPEHKFQDTLFTFWTFKEAIIKALGVGLNADLTKIDLSDFYYTNRNCLVFDNNEAYTIQQISAIDGYKAAIAIKGYENFYTEYNFNEFYPTKIANFTS